MCRTNTEQIKSMLITRSLTGSILNPGSSFEYIRVIPTALPARLGAAVLLRASIGEVIRRSGGAGAAMGARRMKHRVCSE
jgi:hypothetical protein